MSIQSRNLNRLREVQARAESPPASAMPSPAFYGGYESGRHTLERGGDFGVGKLATNGAMRVGQRVAVHGGIITATPRTPLEEVEQRGTTQKRGRIKFVYSVRESEDGQEYDALYVAGWKPGHTEEVVRFKLGEAYLVNANIDNLGGDRWLVDVCYAKGTVNGDGVPTSGQTYCFAQYRNDGREWAIEIDAPNIGSDPLQISPRPLGYGFWICSWLPGRNIARASGQTSKPKSRCEDSGYSRRWQMTQDTLPQELIVYNGEMWAWETGDRSVGSYEWSESPAGAMQIFPLPFYTGSRGQDLVMGPACVTYGNSNATTFPFVASGASGNTGDAIGEYCRSLLGSRGAGFWGVAGVEEYCVGPPTKFGGDSWDVTQGRVTLLPDYRKSFQDIGGKGRDWYASYRIDPDALYALGEAITRSKDVTRHSFTMFSKAGDGPATQPRTSEERQASADDRGIDEEMKVAPTWRMADIEDQALFTVISSRATGQEITPDEIRQLQDVYKDNPDALLAAVRPIEEDLPDRQLARQWAEYILFELQEADPAPYPTGKVESLLTSPTPLMMALNEFAIVETYRDFKLTEQHREKIYAGELLFPKRGGRTIYTIYNMSYAESERNPSSSSKPGTGEDTPSPVNTRPVL